MRRKIDRLYRSSANELVDASGMQSNNDDKGAEEAAGRDCNVKTAIWHCQQSRICKSLSKNVQKKILRLREK